MVDPKNKRADEDNPIHGLEFHAEKIEVRIGKIPNWLVYCVAGGSFASGAAWAAILVLEFVLGLN